MSLSLQIHNKAKSTNANKQSYLGISNGFIINLYDNEFYQNNKRYWRLSKINKISDMPGFEGIMLEDLSINFQTAWGDAGGAVLGSTLAKYLNSKFFKFLAGVSDNGFQPFICSDAWTQQKVNGDAQPIKVQLKFKAFKDDKLGCTNYNDILKFLIHICSPLKSTTIENNPKILDENGKETEKHEQLSDQLFTNLDNTLNGAGNLVDAGGNIINGVVQAGKKIISSENFQEVAAGLSRIVNTVNSVYTETISSVAGGKNNANFTVNFRLGNTSNNSNYENASKINSTIDKSNANDTLNIMKIDWIINSFTFKPSRQFVFEDNIPKPLWMDFDVSLETRFSLSNRYVYEILMPNNLTMSKIEDKK